jgi:hypothetical protein
MEKASTPGKTVHSTSESSKQGSSMGKAVGRAKKAPKATSTKVTTVLIRNRATGSSHGPVGTRTKVSIKTMKETAMEKCAGQTVAFIKENGVEESSMATAK